MSPSVRVQSRVLRYRVQSLLCVYNVHGKCWGNTAVDSGGRGRRREGGREEGGGRRKEGGTPGWGAWSAGWGGKEGVLGEGRGQKGRQSDSPSLCRSRQGGGGLREGLCACPFPRAPWGLRGVPAQALTQWGPGWGQKEQELGHGERY